MDIATAAELSRRGYTAAFTLGNAQALDILCASPTGRSFKVEAKGSAARTFIDNMLGILPLLGIDAFEQSPTTTSTGQTPLLTCHGKGVVATGYDTPQGFVVKSGSFAASEEAPSLKDYFPNLTKIRSDLVTRGVLIPEGNKFRFTQDYTFNSPSQASSVVFANSSNGRVDWKDSSGRTLKQLQEAQANSPV